MKTNNIICSAFLLMTLLIASSCHKKFDHKSIAELETPANCPLCSYADSLQGTYRGFATGFYAPPQGDSLTITMEHIYLSLANSLDSTKMFFKRSKQYDSSSSPEIDTLAIFNNSGIFYSGSSYNLSIIGDSLHIYDFYYDNQMPSATAILLKFDGKKIP